MLPLNLWEHQNAVKTLYSRCVERVCERHDLTRMELDILLFLANNPLYDTASEIVEIRYLSKSQVSSSVKTLEAKGYLRREYAGGNRKTAHLKICDNALAIIADGRAAQEKFVEVMFRGISREEAELMQRCNERIHRNVDQYLKEEIEECTSF